MIHDAVTLRSSAAAGASQSQPCACHTARPRLGFLPASGSPDWHWILIAALAALVIFQAFEGKRR